MKRTKGDRQKQQSKTRVRRRRLLRVPPPDSTVWPEEYRGQRWKRRYALLFAGKCQLCAYSCPLSPWRQGMDKFAGLPRLLLCTNHPHSPGALKEVLPIETCRNFKPKHWRRPSAPAVPDSSSTPCEETDPTVRRIPVGHNLFATVDAADYKKLNKYKWRASPHGRTVYANCCTGGRTVSMHRMIMRPRRGYVVDHIDGNGLNNRRCNLRVCTAAQNRTNQRPRGGSSRFVGVYRHQNKWAAGIRYRGEYHYLGLFEDEVEAAKARDRKAYELHGEHAYLNFPQDCARYRKMYPHKAAKLRRKAR